MVAQQAIALLRQCVHFLLRYLPMFRQHVELAVLRGHFLAFAHDDGWYLKLLYTAWDDVAALLAGAIAPALGTLDMDALQRGGDGYWLQDGVVNLELTTHDIDSVLNRRL